ncbi:MAG: bacterioferritin [Acidimicrobiales bacterium]|nr:bacterioferritin [Acidimicrobiales bacterium]
MTGDDRIIELLNEVLTAELTAINQYFIDAKMCGNWGLARLAEKFRHESIDEMKDADELIDRILYLDGVPNMQRLGSVRVGDSVSEKLELALELEKAAIERLNRAIGVAVEAADNGSRELFEKILVGEESHADWLEAQLSLIDQLGEPLYLSQQIRD